MRYLISAQHDPAQLYKIGLGSVRCLLAVGDLVIGWHLLRGAEIEACAIDSGDTDHDLAFYEGKVVTAKFFAKTILPEISAVRSVLETIDVDLMDLHEDAF